MKRQNALYQASKVLEHRTAVLNAALWYLQFNWMTTDGLARSLNVSGNTINKWLCEAVANRYIINDEICIQIMRKHVREYEHKHQIKNSSLRQMYKNAFEARSKGKNAIDVDAIINGKQKACH
ncbi:MAG: hypothetical protein IJ272_01180 [Clostridia bacterium]|nr:hypothetical protein [Clostridia bacterium]